MDKINNIFELLKIDWVDLPNILKYCCYIVIVGFGLLLTDENFGMRMIQIKSRPTGLLLILVFSFAVPAIYLLYSKLRRLYYRLRYPIRNLGKDFYFSQEGNKGFTIIDKKKKVIRWIENPIIAYDLGYIDSLWFDLIQRKEVATQGENVNLDAYKMGKSIRTRGKPALANRLTTGIPPSTS